LEADGVAKAGESELPRGGADPVGPSGGGPSAEDLLLGTGAEESDKGKDDTKQLSTGMGDPVRKRLCSFVVSASGAQSTPEEKEQGQAAKKKNEETERAGADLLRRFFEGQGLVCHSLETDNVGYDFEVAIGGRTICIELKTSRDKWRGWEHSLSPNEFKTAMAKGDDYFLCIIDRVFEEGAREVYFIQNPAGKITDYLFDAPWKSVKCKMEDWITRIKAQENVLSD
jgi:hypothetical protein